MNAALLTALFWSCAVAVAVSQAMILRSTIRAWRLGVARSAVAEWLFATVPAAVLAGVLWLSWGVRP
jgi:hypothetical protein